MKYIILFITILIVSCEIMNHKKNETWVWTYNRPKYKNVADSVYVLCTFYNDNTMSITDMSIAKGDTLFNLRPWDGPTQDRFKVVIEVWMESNNFMDWYFNPIHPMSPLNPASPMNPNSIIYD